MKILSADRFMNPEDGTEMVEKAYVRYEAEVNKMADAYISDENRYKCILNIQKGDEADILQNRLDEIKYVAPWSEQFWYLFIRAVQNSIRSPISTFARFVIVLFVMLLGLALFYQVFYNDSFTE